MLLIEWFAVIFGLLSVILTVRQNIWCWPVGLAQVFLYIFVFYRARLYSDMILHVIYVALQIYGWNEWLHGGRDRKAPEITRLTAPKRVFAWSAMLTAGFLWGAFMARYTHAAAPYADALIVSASLFATYFLAKKIIDAWFIWIGVDILAVSVYFYKHLFPTALLYSVFLFLAVLGFFEWRKSFLQRKENP